MPPDGLELEPERIRAAFLRSAGAVPAVTPRMQRHDADGAPVPRPTGPAEGQRALPAAVLVLLYPRDGRTSLVLTRRAADLPHHAGQISFPGGAVDPEDPSPLAAALREAREELGVDEACLAVWGALEPIFVSASGYMVHGFVAHSATLPRFQPAAGEVAAVLQPTLASLLRRTALTTQERLYEGRIIREPFFGVDGERVWGATAVLLDQFLTRIEVGLAGAEGGA